jgi:hypothetical protein
LQDEGAPKLPAVYQGQVSVSLYEAAIGCMA